MLPLHQSPIDGIVIPSGDCVIILTARTVRCKGRFGEKIFGQALWDVQLRWESRHDGTLGGSDAAVRETARLTRLADRWYAQWSMREILIDRGEGSKLGSNGQIPKCGGMK